MKEDVKMKDILNAAPKGTMPQVGAMQHMQASPKVSPAQAPPKVMPEKTTPNVSPAQAVPKVSPIQNAPKVSPIQNMPKVMPEYTMPKVMPEYTMPSAMPSAMPEQSMPNVMAAESMLNMSPMQMMPDDMPVQAWPGGVMPSMMNQIPIMCCPYLMNMQCPMTHGANVMGMNMMNNAMFPGVSPVTGNMMPYAGNAAPVMGAANNNMYAQPETGTLPASINNPYLPMGGMNY